MGNHVACLRVDLVSLIESGREYITCVVLELFLDATDGGPVKVVDIA